MLQIIAWIALAAGVVTASSESLIFPTVMVTIWAVLLMIDKKWGANNERQNPKRTRS